MFLVLGFCLKVDDNFDVYNMMMIILVFIMMIIMMMMIMIMTISIFMMMKMMMMMAMCRAIAEIFTASAGITPVMRSVSLH